MKYLINEVDYNLPKTGVKLGVSFGVGPETMKMITILHQFKENVIWLKFSIVCALYMTNLIYTFCLNFIEAVVLNILNFL